MVEVLPESEWKSIGEEVVDEDGAFGHPLSCVHRLRSIPLAAKGNDPDADPVAESGDSTTAPTEGSLHRAAAPTTKPREVQPTGKVVGILKRAFRPYVCTLDRASLPPSALTSSASVTVLASPVQRTLPRIRLLTRQAAHLASQKFLVSIDRWPITSRYPEGHFVRVLGQVGSKEGEVESLLEEWEVPYRPFSSAILSCLPEEGDKWVVPPKGEADVKNVWRAREDLRDEIICSIDPPGASSSALRALMYQRLFLAAKHPVLCADER